MIIAGTNFALWYRGLFRGLVHFRRDEELRVYLALIDGRLGAHHRRALTRDIGNAHDAVRNGIFQTVVRDDRHGLRLHGLRAVDRA